MKNIYLQIQAQKKTRKTTTKISTPNYIIVKLLKDKAKKSIVKTTEKKQE